MTKATGKGKRWREAWFRPPPQAEATTRRKAFDLVLTGSIWRLIFRRSIRLPCCARSRRI